jgi:hypothetical protein
MLDPWIIEEILRREEEKRRDQQQRIEVPIQSPRRNPAEANPPPAPTGEERGVAIIDI